MYVDIHSHRASPPGAVTLRNDLSPEEAAQSGTFCTAGIHPWKLSENGFSPDFETLLEKLRHPRTIAVGECGIDRIHKPVVPEQRQTEVFLAQANLAAALHKPLILHCVRAGELILDLRKRFFTEAPVWIFHGFHGTGEEALQLLRYGIVISAGPRLLEGAKPELLRDYQRAGFFLETDDSDLGIADIYALAADILNTPSETLEETILERFRRYFL